MLKKNFNNLSIKLLILIFFLTAFSFHDDQNLKYQPENFFTKSFVKHLAARSAYAKDSDESFKWPHEQSDLLPDPALKFGRLPNGFRYILIKNKKPENRVSMHLNVQAGSINETDNQTGLAHFLEHLLFCGSTHFKPGELVKYFQSIGMAFGNDANAHTGFYETVYDIMLPKGGTGDLEKGLTVIKDYAQGALLLQSEIDRERGVILAEKRARDSASYRTFVSSFRFELNNSRTTKRLPIGKEDIIKNSGQKIIKDFYDTWYRPENMIIIMAGDFDLKTAASLVEARFKDLSARAPARTVPWPDMVNHTGVKTFYHHENESGNTSVSIEVIKSELEHPDSAALQNMLVKKSMAERIIQNRLDAIVGSPNTVFTSASISSGLYLRQFKYAAVSAECSPENWKKSLGVIEQTLRKALKFGFTESELEIVKKDFLSELDMAVKKESTRDSSKLAREIIWHINNNRVFMSPEQEKILFSPVIDSTTPDELLAVFKKIWPENHRLVLVTGNADLDGSAQKPENIILDVYNKSLGKEVVKPAELKMLKFPYLAEPVVKGKIKSRKDIKGSEIIQVDFKNGVRLNLKKTDFSASQVLIKLAFGSGRSLEPSDKPGLTALSRAVINESCLGAMKKDELERAMAGKNTFVKFGAGEDSFFLTGRTVSNEVELMFQLMYAHITDPGYREEAYKLTLERFQKRYKALSSSIDGAMVLSGKSFIAGKDSRFGLPAWDVFKKLTIDDIRSWVNKSLKEAPLEISMAGDFNIEETIETASKYIGSMPARQGFESRSIRKLPEFPFGKTKNITVPTKISKGLIVVAYPTDDMWDIQRTRRLSVLAGIFSDRIRENIRVKLGAAYSPFAFNRSSRAYKGYGTLQVYIHIDPEQADMVTEHVKKVAADLAVNGISQEELDRVIKPAITGIKDMQKTNTYWLNTVLADSIRHPEQIDWSQTIIKGYSSIKVNEISKMASKYLDNSKCATIIIKPEQGL